MKRILSLSSIVLILTFLLVSCGKYPKIEKGEDQLAQGQFSLQLGTMGSFEVVTKSTETVDVKDFTVRVYGKTLRETAFDSTWLRYDEMPSVVTIPAGKYTIEAYNGEQRSGFEVPYYYGKKEFSVGVQELTDAQVTCQLACVKLTVEFTSLFLSNVTDPVCIIHHTEGTSIEFDPKVDKGIGYISAPADSTLAVTIRGKYTEDNSEVDRTYFIKSVGAKQWHKIALSVNTEAGIENGGGMIQVDHSVDEKEATILVPGGGDLIDNNGDSGSWDDDGEEKPDDGEKEDLPDIVGTSLNGAAFNIDEIIEKRGNNIHTLEITLTAPSGGIQNLFLVMHSTNSALQMQFEAMGGSNDALPMDLANPGDLLNPESGSWQEILSSSDINVINPQESIKGKKSYVFSIGGFMPMLIAPIDDSPYCDHTFNIKIVDGSGNDISKVLTVRTYAE